MSNLPDNLDKAYQDFKRRHNVPGHSKAAVMRAARGRQATGFNWQSWGRGLAAGVAVFGITLFILLNQQVFQPVDTITLVNHVQLHGYTPESETAATRHQQQKEWYYQQYARQELVLTRRYSQSATVVENNGELALSTCQDDVIKLSDTLVSRMLAEQRLSPSLAPGDGVDIDFNQDGYIVSVRKLPAPKQC